jgi:transposase
LLLSPDLAPDSHLPRRRDFDYRRNGITDLLAFLNPRTGEIYGECTADHNRHTLCRVLKNHVETHHPDAVIHYIMDNLSCHYHDDFCQTVAELSNVSYAPLGNGAERRKWLRSEDKRIAVHFIPFHASWLNMVEIWFGILKSKCLSYGHFMSVEQLRESIVNFIDTWNRYFAHPFNWSYTGAGLHQSAVRRFCRLLLIETDQMDSKFLRSQLAMMNNIAENHLELISTDDWQRFLSLAVDKKNYMLNIIENESGPKRQKQARDIYDQFRQTVLNDDILLAIAG